MPNSFTQVFGGTTIYPADVSYLALALTANTSLEWPLEATAGSTVVARIIDITPTGSYTITMPEATSVSVGQTVLFNNIGPNTVFIVKADGGAILSIAAGEQWQAYLIDNATVGGTWRTLRYGASTAQAQAAALAGPGLITEGSQLAQNYEVIDFSVTPYTLTAPDRAKVFIWDGGLGTLNLPSAPSAGDGWFVQVRNAGQGDLTIDPSGTELINAGSTLNLQPGDSAVIVSNGTQWYTIGLGQQAVFAFDYTSIAVTGGTYTLSGSELNRIAYKFTGTLVSNVTIVVPATVQQYWVNNATTGSFTLSLRAAGSGTSTPVTQASTSILYCDGTDIIPATTAVTFAGILPVTQGGTGANNAPSARTNLGATGIGSSLFTAVSEAAARSAISAAKSGANSDITSLTGLTTPLSVPQGGTGAATLTANGILLGNGTSAIQITAVGATGQVLVGNTGAAPSWTALSGIGVTSLSFGSTGLTPATATTGAITVAGTLGVANGGTGTATAFTAGSVVFAGASGVYSQSNSNLFWDNVNGRLGVATSSPTERLTVAGNTKVGEGVASSTSKLMVNTLSGTAAGIQLIQDANESWIIQNPASTNVLTFGNSGTERMRIDASGNVGIGTTIPSSYGKLAVRGNINASTDGATLLTMRANANATDLSAYNATGAYLAFQTTPNGGGELERMRITAAGNVGIGTSNPSVQFVVSNASAEGYEINATGGLGGGATVSTYNRTTALYTSRTTYSSAHTWYVSTAGTTRAMDLTSAGDVGIGTTSPQLKFVVSNAGAAGLEIDPTAVASAPVIQSYNRSGAAYTQLTYSALQHVFQISGNEAMRITSAGDVGIGSSSSGARLEVTRTDAANGIRVTVGQGAYSGNVALFGVTGQSNGYYITKDAVNNIQHIWDGTGGVERMRITSGGNVGIGTTSPSASLEVSSSSFDEIVRVTGAGSPYVSWYTGGTRRGYIQAQAGSLTVASDVGLPLLLATDTTERMRIDSAGNVMIGTTAANNKFLVTYANPITVPAAGAGGHCTAFGTVGYGLATGAVTNGNAYLQATRWDGTATNYDLLLQPNGGNVGIGTSTPGSLLDINGGNMSLSRTNTAGSLTGITVVNAGTTSAYAGINIISGPVTSQLFNDAAGNAVVAGTVLRTTTAHPLVFGTNNTERMRITAGGDVGINTSSPSPGLDVNNVAIWCGTKAANPGNGGNVRFRDDTGTFRYATGILGTAGATSYSIFDNVAAAERLTITSAGNVGIGTIIPESPLQVIGRFRVQNDGVVRWGSSVVTGSYNESGYLTWNTGRVTVGYEGTGAVSFETTGAERMRITSAGLVGIGTSSPQRILGIGGTTSAYMNFNPTSHRQFTVGSDANGFIIFDDVTAFYRQVIDTSGNVGFNLNAPSYPLEVRADAASSASYIGITNTTATGGTGAAGYLARAGSNFAYFYVRGDGTAYIDNATANPLGFATNGSERMRISGAGDVGIGTSSPQAKVEVNGGLDGVYNANVLVTSTANTAKLAFNPTGVSSSGVGNVGGGLVFYASGANTERARITSSGNLLVGISSGIAGADDKVQVDTATAGARAGVFRNSDTTVDTIAAWNAATSGDNVFIKFYTEAGASVRGSITYNRAGGLVAYNTTSDYRAKNILGPVENTGTTIDALKVHTGKMHDATIERPMLVAHEAQEVVPYAVTGEKDAVNEDGTPDYQQVDHQVLIPLLIAEIQSLRARVAQLEERK